MEYLTSQQIQMLIGSPDAQRLLGLLQQDGGSALQQASQAIRSGNYVKAQTILKPLFSDADTAALAAKLLQNLG